MTDSATKLDDQFRIVRADDDDAAAMDEARRLFVAYSKVLDFSLCFQGFDEELRTLPGMYARPGGGILLAYGSGSEAVGIVGLRGLDAERCEMKRLYVEDRARGHGLGRRLACDVIDLARSIGYRRMVLDTVPEQLPEASALYKDLGFLPCEPYYHNPVPGVGYFSLDL